MEVFRDRRVHALILIDRDRVEQMRPAEVDDIELAFLEKPCDKAYNASMPADASPTPVGRFDTAYTT